MSGPFGRYVNMLVPLGTVDEAWRQKARAASGDISSVGLNTNLVEALDKALYEATQKSQFDQTVILLTDGRIDMDTSGGALARRRIQPLVKGLSALFFLSTCRRMSVFTLLPCPMPQMSLCLGSLLWKQTASR